MDKQGFYSTELNHIKNEEVRNWTIKALNSLPDYVFYIAASSTGKYHPSYALGDGGLVRHTKAATRIAIDLFRLYSFTDEEKDVILSALLLHNGKKSGDNANGYTVHDHPVLVCNHLKQQEFFNDIPQANQICEGIISHMGQWTTSNKSSVVLPKPTTRVQKYIHLCDYLASRKFIEFNFDVVL